MSVASPEPANPRWNSTTKIIIGLTMAGLVVTLMFYMRSIIGPLLLVGVIAYLLHPIASMLSNKTRLSWKMSVNLVYILVIIVLAGLSTAAGLAIVQQAQNLIRTLENVLRDLPEILTTLTSQVYTFGPFQLNLGQYLDVNTLSSQLLALLQPVLGRAGTLVGTLASGAASIATWLFFILLISYFTLSDAGQFPDAINFINIPGYSEDIRRMSRELGRIWNAFLRGQVTIVVMVIITYTVLWTILGTRYALALAVLAGLSRFVPYLGAWITWIALIAVTLFQGSNYFHLQPLQYSLLVVIPTLVIDWIYDNLVSPRILGHSLRISPGAVLVVAIVAANLIGIIGLILAAPVLATVQLLGRYILRKMVDQDPWPEPERELANLPLEEGNRIMRRLRAWWRVLSNKK
jgi:predicted PurR-regulated permease PerM